MNSPALPRTVLWSMVLFAGASSAQDFPDAGPRRLDGHDPLPTSQATWRSAAPSPPPSEPVNPLAHLRFRDQQPLVNRLRRLQALPFVTLWDSRDATLYVGVNRDGETGLHLRQKRDDRGTRSRKSLIRAEDELPARTRQQRRSGPRRVAR